MFVTSYVYSLLLGIKSKFAINNHLRKAIDAYEDFIGIKEIKVIQQNVLEAEKVFIESTKSRRLVQTDLLKVQESLKQIRQKIDSVHRSDEAYLELITNEHKLIKSEVNLFNELKIKEELERNSFTKFSQKLREAHEVERLRQEKVKYLSVIGSVFGAVLGVLATTINNTFKNKEFKHLMQVIRESNSKIMISKDTQTDEILINDMSNESNTLVNRIDEEIPLVNTKLRSVSESEVEESSKNEIKDLFISTQKNLEYKMKMNAIVSVAIIYASIAVTLPLILRFID